jgi:biotin transport system substrate-specific component
MASTSETKNTILDIYQPKDKTKKIINNIAFAFLGSILLTISAKINIPFIGVPATFQTLVVAAIAAAFGWRTGVATVSLYLMQGIMGLPVFAYGGGAAYLFGPTGGFLLGFLPAAFVIGKLADMGFAKKLLPTFLSMTLGTSIIFAFGFAWLMTFAGSAAWLDQSNLIGSAYAIAIEPFIIWDILKMALAAISVVGAWKLIKK